MDPSKNFHDINHYSKTYLSFGLNSVLLFLWVSTIVVTTITAMTITVTMKDTTTPLKMASGLSVFELVGGSAGGGNGRVVLLSSESTGGAEK